uniref:Uncharacterized protein n=1 Tax=Strombidium inclinatum TaxID=197538 RepID=A0A7S3IE15_9SPIT
MEGIDVDGVDYLLVGCLSKRPDDPHSCAQDEDADVELAEFFGDGVIILNLVHARKVSRNRFGGEVWSALLQFGQRTFQVFFLVSPDDADVETLGCQVLSHGNSNSA